ncbi:MAG: PKD domain-containing protein [Rhodothermales bacterium]
MLRYVVFFLVIVATLSPNQSTAQTVPDSIRMEISVLSYEETSPDGFWFNCGSFVIGTWPNDAARILDREVGYSAYQLVATEGMYIPRGYGAIDPATLPEGYLGHHSQMGGAGSMPAHSKDLTGCSQARANAEYVASGAEVLLNARPFRVTEWYAVYNVDAGTPVAGFVWEQTEGLTIKFDGSFQHSREIETTGSVPVESYAWDLGNGESSTSDAFSFTYEEPGTYAVTLEVTDDDGQTAQFTQNVKVRSAVLEYRVRGGTVACWRYAGSVRYHHEYRSFRSG